MKKGTPPSMDPMSGVDLEENFLLLKQLADTSACTGNEEPITAKLYDLAKKLCDEVQIDALGSVIATIKGNPGDYTILIDAHCDEIGFQVVFIESDGYLRIAEVGGQNPRILPGSRVVIHSSHAGDLIGIIGERPIHHMSAEDLKKTSELTKLFVDIGLSSKDDVLKRVAIGDFITLDQQAIKFPDSSVVTGKAFDDRAGCWVAIRTLQWLKQRAKIRPNITVVFAVQEEIGSRGTTASSFRVNPDLAIVLEVGHAIDYPGATKNEFGDISLGKGPIIPLGPNIHPKISRKLLDLAKDKNIPIQTLALPRPAMNDARIVQITRQGIPTGIITIPLRYMHTAIETLDLKDLHLVAYLLTEFLISDPWAH
jgi:putative aminopeptidase FrvX